MNSTEYKNHILTLLCYFAKFDYVNNFQFPFLEICYNSSMHNNPLILSPQIIFINETEKEGRERKKYCGENM